MDRRAELQKDFDRLGELLQGCDEWTASAAAALARERRILGEQIERLGDPEEVPFVDEVGARRRAKAGDSRPPARRRQS